MQTLRYIHRLITLFAVIPLLFLAVTGTLIQAIDLRSILTHAPASDPDLQAMRESFDGPPDFAVRRTADYLAPPLPAAADYAAMLGQAVVAAQAKLGNAPWRYVEFRMIGATPVVQFGLGAGHASFDARSGAFLAQTIRDLPDPPQTPSTRNTVKGLHRLTAFGDWALYITLTCALALAAMAVTGTLIYWKLLRQRRKIRRPALFWSAGGRWRSLHRAVSLLCLAFLAVVTISGIWLSSESLYRSIDVAAQIRHPTPPTPVAPLTTGEMPAMLRNTLAALARNAPGAPLKVIRLRHYGPYRQGVVVTGDETSLTGEETSRQLVFNADTGGAMSETEPFYPRVHFPFGWQAHQLAKSIHRGDIIGLTGRWMDLLAGLALTYLTASGMVMYWEMWQRRRAGGRARLLWR